MLNHLLQNAHPIVVHFPIALLMFAVLLEVWNYVRPSEGARTASLIALILGTAGAAAAVATGDDDVASNLIDAHEMAAQATLAVFGALSAWRILLRGRTVAGRLAAVYLTAAIVGLGLLGYTGYLGGSMVYEQGIGVRGNTNAASQPPSK